MADEIKTHSRIGASSAHRWFNCPGSVRLSEIAPPQPSNKYAEQGTAAHWVIEQYLSSDKDVDVYGFVGQAAPNGYELTTEDIDSVAEFLKTIDSIRSTGKYILHSEVKFDLSTIYPGLFGTGDVVLVETNLKRLKVIDYKHGSGVPVEVENNKQLLYYALGAMQYVANEHKIDYLSTLGWGHTFSEVEIMIVQPRCRHRGGIVRSWVADGQVLEAFAVELKKAAELTADEKAPFKTGDHCRFCPALSICRAFQEKSFELAQSDFKAISSPANLKLPDPNALSLPEIAKVLRFADLISAWLAAVEGNAKVRIEHGEDIPGFKLVEKKTNRQWVDEEQAKETLTLYVKDEDMYEKKFLSPAKAEKLLGKKQKKVVEDLCFKPQGDTTLAPEHDPREAVKGSAVSDFSALE